MLKTSNPPIMPPPTGHYGQVVEVPPNARKETLGLFFEQYFSEALFLSHSKINPDQEPGLIT
jgi:hypothetical protein